MYLRRVSSCLVLLLSAIVLSNCACSSYSELAQKRAKRKRWISIALSNDPGTLDSRFVYSTHAITLCSLINEGLYQSGPDGKPQLGIAQSVEISEDKRSYTFHLRAAVWSNGDPVTAYDFEKTWRQLLEPGFPAPMADQLYVIEHAKAVKGGTLSADLLPIRALDAHTLQVRLVHPSTYFPELLTLPVFFAVHPSLLDKQGASQTEGIICNGPFLLNRWRSEHELAFTKNYSYWNANNMTLDSVYLRFLITDPNTAVAMLESGELTWAGSPLSTLPTETLQNTQFTKQTPAAATEWISINTQHPVLRDSALRGSLYAGIDRQALVEHVLPGGHIPATGIVPPYLGGSARSDTDLSSSIASIAPLTLSYSDSPRRHQIAQALQQMWKEKLGIEVRLERMDFKVLIEKQNSLNYDMALGSWFADYADASNFLEVFESCDSPSNRTGWEDAVYSLMLQRATRETDPVQRKSYLAQAEDILIKQAPVIPLFHYSMVHMDNGEIEGALITETGRLELRHAHWK